jgi:hypothetical protein
MKFNSNRIFTGQAKTFEDVVKSYTEKKLVKTASVKVAEKDEAESSGQLKVEPLHQKGESTEATPSSGCKCDKKEAPSSGQPEAEAKLVNEPKVEDKKADATVTTKEAEFSTKKCPECGMCGGLCKCKGKGKGKGKGDCDGTGKGDGECNKDKKIEKEGDDDADDTDAEAKAKEAIKAASTGNFVKIANLDSKTKSWLNTYWKKLFPASFVDAMLADK